MLTDIQRQAIIRCLTDIDALAARAHPHPVPNLLAVLVDRSVPGHPRPGARRLGVNPLPVPPHAWNNPDGPVAVLRTVGAALRSPVVQAMLTAATGHLRLLACVFLHTDVVIDDDLGPQQVRFIDAVDIDDQTYILTRLPGTPAGAVTVHPPGASDDSGAVEALRAMARDLRTH